MNQELIIILKAIHNEKILCKETTKKFSCYDISCSNCPLIPHAYSCNFYVTKIIKLGRDMI